MNKVTWKSKIVVLTSDKYVDAILPFAYLLDKHWADHPPVIVGGFSPPTFDMPDGFTFHSIGKFEDYPVSRWSDGLIKLLTNLKEEVVLLMLEDMWITRFVPSQIVKMCEDYMFQFSYVARLDLTGDRLNAGDSSLYAKLGDMDLIWSNPYGQYHLSMMPAFWRTSHLLRVLRPGETPWQTELSGTPRLGSLNKEVIVLGTNAWPIRNTLAFRGGSTGELLTNEIAKDDLDQLTSLGLLDKWRKKGNKDDE